MKENGSVVISVFDELTRYHGGFLGTLPGSIMLLLSISLFFGFFLFISSGREPTASIGVTAIIAIGIILIFSIFDFNIIQTDYEKYNESVKKWNISDNRFHLAMKRVPDSQKNFLYQRVARIQGANDKKLQLILTQGYPFHIVSVSRDRQRFFIKSDDDIYGLPVDGVKPYIGRCAIFFYCVSFPLVYEGGAVYDFRNE